MLQRCDISFLSLDGLLQGSEGSEDGGVAGLVYSVFSDRGYHLKERGDGVLGHYFVFSAIWTVSDMPQKLFRCFSREKELFVIA